MTASPAPTRAVALVAYLQTLAVREDRGALAALRRGLGKEAGTVPDMYRHVEPYLQGAGRLQTEAAYLVASLFGLHPVVWDPEGAHPWNTSFGWSLHHIRFRSDGSSEERKEDEGVARRFLAALACDLPALPIHLRQLLALLHSRWDTAPINWERLYWDVVDWGDVDRRVQRRWAEAFWRGGSQPSADDGSALDSQLAAGEDD